MIAQALAVLGDILLLAGAALVVIGALGLLRLPDFFARTHGASITDSAGAVMMLAGLLCHAPDGATALRLVLVTLFLLIASPTASHALANAALADGIRPLARDKRRDRQRA